MKKLLSTLFVMTFALAAWSQNADGIVKKYFESIGGIDKWKSLKSVKMNGKIPTPQGEFDFEMLRKMPNKYMISVDVMGQKLIPQAYDGEVAWTLNPFTGDTAQQRLPDDQLAAIKSQADFEDPFIDYAKKGYEVEYTGEGDVDGVKAYILKLTKNKGKAEEEVMDYYFDAETYLPIMVKQKSGAGQMAGQEMNVYYSDYQDAGDGLMMPFLIDTKTGGQSVMSIKFSKVELNSEISDDVFKYKGK